MPSSKRLSLEYYFCVNCNSKETVIHRIKTKTKGIVLHEDWRIVGENMIMCLLCFNRIFKKEYRKKKIKRKFRFKDKIIITKTEVHRIGVCNLCRAVVPFDCKRTNLHHEKYDDNDMLNHTMETCDSCHNKLSWELGQFKNNIIKHNRICYLCDKKETEENKLYWGKINCRNLCNSCRNRYYHSKNRKEFIRKHLS